MFASTYARIYARAKQDLSAVEAAAEAVQAYATELQRSQAVCVRAITDACNQVLDVLQACVSHTSCRTNAARSALLKHDEADALEVYAKQLCQWAAQVRHETTAAASAQQALAHTPYDGAYGITVCVAPQTLRKFLSVETVSTCTRTHTFKAAFALQSIYSTTVQVWTESCKLAYWVNLPELTVSGPLLITGKNGEFNVKAIDLPYEPVTARVLYRGYTIHAWTLGARVIPTFDCYRPTRYELAETKRHETYRREEQRQRQLAAKRRNKK